MADLDRQLTLETDAGDFLVRIVDFARLIADVADVEAAVRACDLGKLDHLFGGSEMAIFVFEATGKSEGTRLKFAAKQILHALNFVGLGGTVEVLPHDLLTQGGVPD